MGGEAWREQLEPARPAARRLVDRGLVVITLSARVVDPSTARGPIRIRRVDTPPATASALTPARLDG